VLSDFSLLEEVKTGLSRHRLSLSLSCLFSFSKMALTLFAGVSNSGVNGNEARGLITINEDDESDDRQ
jgi:hypothetical protein